MYVTHPSASAVSIPSGYLYVFGHATAPHHQLVTVNSIPPNGRSELTHFRQVRTYITVIGDRQTYQSCPIELHTRTHARDLQIIKNGVQGKLKTKIRFTLILQNFSKIFMFILSSQLHRCSPPV